MTREKEEPASTMIGKAGSCCSLQCAGPKCSEKSFSNVDLAHIRAEDEEGPVHTRHLCWMAEGSGRNKRDVNVRRFKELQVEHYFKPAFTMSMKQGRKEVLLQYGKGAYTRDVHRLREDVRSS